MRMFQAKTLRTPQLQPTTTGVPGIPRHGRAGLFGVPRRAAARGGCVGCQFAEFGPAELRHRNHGQHTHHQQHGFTTVGDVSTGTLTALRAATAASFAATGALTGATLTITGRSPRARWTCESLDCAFTARAAWSAAT